MHEKKTNASTGQTHAIFKGRLDALPSMSVTVATWGWLSWLIVFTKSWVLLKRQLYPKSVQIVATTVELVRFALSGDTGQQFPGKCFIFAYFCCESIERRHTIHLWVNSPREPSRRWERRSFFHLAFSSWTHTKLLFERRIVLALQCVPIQFKHIHANTESPLTLFSTDKLCRVRCGAVQ